MKSADEKSLVNEFASEWDQMSTFEKVGAIIIFALIFSTVFL